MFEIENQRAVLKSVNPRSEKHGPDENVPAVDISLSFDASNELLSHFGSKLRDSLYYKANKAQTEIDGVEATKPDLRNDCLLGPMKIRYEGVGYGFHCDLGVTGDMHIDIEDVRVTKVRIDPKQGGTVNYSLQVQVTDPDPAVVGRLGTMVGDELQITLTAPKA
jgi:hypothetical protein